MYNVRTYTIVLSHIEFDIFLLKKYKAKNVGTNRDNLVSHFCITILKSSFNATVHLDDCFYFLLLLNPKQDKNNNQNFQKS